MGEIMSRTVERTGNDARPLVKVYTKPRLRALFDGFTDIQIVQRQIRRSSSRAGCAGCCRSSSGSRAGT